MTLQRDILSSCGEGPSGPISKTRRNTRLGGFVTSVFLSLVILRTCQQIGFETFSAFWSSLIASSQNVDWDASWPLSDFAPRLRAGSEAQAPAWQPTRVYCSGSAEPHQFSGPIPRFLTPANHPRSVLGKMNLFEAADKCFTYQERYGRYSGPELGMGSGDAPPDWSRHIDQCLDSAQKVLLSLEKSDASNMSSRKRSVLLLRTHEMMEWSEDQILNLRALISELSLTFIPGRLPTEVRILHEVVDPTAAYRISEKATCQILAQVPREFHALVSLWSEQEMKAYFPGLSGDLCNHMTPWSSYRSSFLPVMVFAQQNPHFDLVWNWEENTRSFGDYTSVFDKLENYSTQVSGSELFDSSNSWHLSADVETIAADPAGVGEVADLVTLNPFFNVTSSGWYWAQDIQGYPQPTELPFAASIGRNVRLSRRLLDVMAKVYADDKKSMHCETVPASIILHNNDRRFRRSYSAGTLADVPLKAVFAPHPVFAKRIWDNQALKNHLARADFMLKVNERITRQFSFYDAGSHGRELYKLWKEPVVDGSAVCRTAALLNS